MLRLILAFFLTTASAMAASGTQGAITVLGPIPHLSSSSSPFSAQHRTNEFYLEDFEDGQLNTPGIIDDYAINGHSAILPPSPLTDSVDEDDGQIDGSGTAGHSLISTFITFQLSDPQVSFRHFRFTLNKDYFSSGYPNAFGFVWTDGSPGSTLRLRIFDVAGELVKEQRFHGLGDDANGGTTADDMFFGVLSDQGIGAVEIASVFFGDDRSFEIDHLQYGIVVPESSSVWGMSLALLAAMLHIRISSAACARRLVRFHSTVRSTRWKAEQHDEENTRAI